MKATKTIVIIGLSIFAGMFLTCYRICAMEREGVDLNSMVHKCNQFGAEKDNELRITKWHRKCSEVHHR